MDTGLSRHADGDARAHDDADCCGHTSTHDAVTTTHDWMISSQQQAGSMNTLHVRSTGQCPDGTTLHLMCVHSYTENPNGVVNVTQY